MLHRLMVLRALNASWPASLVESVRGREQRRKEIKGGRESEKERETEREGRRSGDHNRLPVPRSKQALSWHPQKTCPTAELFGPCFKTVSNETRKKRVQAGHHRRCSKWPHLERTHAQHLYMNLVVHAFEEASGFKS